MCFYSRGNFYIQRAKAYLELGLLSEVISDTEHVKEQRFEIIAAQEIVLLICAN